MTITLATVSTMLLTKARIRIAVRSARTAAMLSHSFHSLGQLKASIEASGAVLAAVTRMKANGTRKTTTDTAMAIVPTVHRRTARRLTRPRSFC